ncbi:hypothetical protein BCV69DRAFT_271103 [Microstroma glucosiphilum]|uniref:Stress-response A/B barrel domain-containing protein n=1 Tax=Pseudomicrostroma glucosiphilum TaxID=1684307 RepID=A0A316UA77_9BASI|nr:hypothetical protein BCV69DRAFT_271103 [Pseudomicrostroma glucosiphilum]PWN19925.1 hypothetical protein BCV69DRAFT_271103 [Pseudomicrostroma glucosiphilum]
MPYIHVVAFTYRSDVTDSDKAELVKSLRALETECVNEQGKPYIRDFKLGEANISPEGAGKGFEHLFIVTFDSKKDVQYYLEKDPVHVAFGERAKAMLSDCFIYDFEQ